MAFGFGPYVCVLCECFVFIAGSFLTKLSAKVRTKVMMYASQLKSILGVARGLLTLVSTLKNPYPRPQGGGRIPEGPRTRLSPSSGHGDDTKISTARPLPGCSRVHGMVTSTNVVLPSTVTLPRLPLSSAAFLVR